MDRRQNGNKLPQEAQQYPVGRPTLHRCIQNEQSMQ
jgi:hypothetical protein